MCYVLLSSTALSIHTIQYPSIWYQQYSSVVVRLLFILLQPIKKYHRENLRETNYGGLCNLHTDGTGGGADQNCSYLCLN